MKAAGYRLTDEGIEAISQLKRQALHAMELQLTHPKTGEIMEFACPLPDDLVALENALAALTIRG